MSRSISYHFIPLVDVPFDTSSCNILICIKLMMGISSENDLQKRHSAHKPETRLKLLYLPRYHYPLMYELNHEIIPSRVPTIAYRAQILTSSIMSWMNKGSEVGELQSTQLPHGGNCDRDEWSNSRRYGTFHWTPILSSPEGSTTSTGTMKKVRVLLQSAVLHQGA